MNTYQKGIAHIELGLQYMRCAKEGHKGLNIAVDLESGQETFMCDQCMEIYTNEEKEAQKEN